MRICLLATSTTAHQMGGSEVHAELLAAEAARQGHRVFILTTAHPAGLRTETKDGCEVRYLPGTSHTMSRREAPAWWRESAEKAARLCAEEKIDVVWAENFSGLAYAALPRAERRPVVSVINGLAVRGEIASNFNRISTAGELAFFLTRYAAQTIFYYIPRFRALVRDSDLLVGVSNETVEALHAEFPSSRGKTEVILNPVDTGFFRPDAELRRAGRLKLGCAAGETVVLMSGVLHKQKGLHLGLRAFARLAAGGGTARLVIAGDGPERENLKELAAGLGIAGRVSFLGLVPNREMPLFYDSADVYLNPTLRLEGLPMVLLEAMACGLPCVTSRIGGTGSSIEDGKSGYFTRPGDVPALADRLGKLLADPTLRADLGAGARRRAELVFNKETVTSAYLAASERLLGAGA